MSFRRNLAAIAASAMLAACGSQEAKSPTDKYAAEKTATENVVSESVIEKLGLEYTLSPQALEIMGKTNNLQRILGYIKADANGNGDITVEEANLYRKKVTEEIKIFLSGGNEKYSESPF